MKNKVQVVTHYTDDVMGILEASFIGTAIKGSNGLYAKVLGSSSGSHKGLDINYKVAFHTAMNDPVRSDACILDIKQYVDTTVATQERRVQEIKQDLLNQEKKLAEGKEIQKALKTCTVFDQIIEVII